HAKHVGEDRRDRPARTYDQYPLRAGRAQIGERAEHPAAKPGEWLVRVAGGFSPERAVGPCIERFTQDAEMFARFATLRQRLALQVRVQQRMAVVFVQPGILSRIEVLAEALGDAGYRFRIAPPPTAQTLVERSAALGKIFAQPARLAPAEFREPVVIIRPEGRLGVPHQHQFRHIPGLYGTIAA